jgi:hypothetical protein
MMASNSMVCRPFALRHFCSLVLVGTLLVPAAGMAQSKSKAKFEPPLRTEKTDEASPSQKVANGIAQFSGLDKITGRIFSFEVQIDETVQFGALHVTPKACYTRPSTSTPQTTAYLEVDEVTLSKELRRVFTGWMFAASPGLHAIEHPIYDVWLTGCRSDQQADGASEASPRQPQEAEPAQQPSKPVPAKNQKKSNR